jgi:probable F420-dependent oxidoreductase
MVLFGYLAAITRRIELVTGILILPQRQTALVAKQAAEVDLLSGGRLRLGVGIGWNHVEYEGLGEDFHNRGRRIEEQIAVLRGLFSQPSFSLEGKYHHIVKAGINPLPRRPIPIWMGGQSEQVVERAGRLADGWMPLYPNPGDIAAPLATMRDAARRAGRDPSKIGVDARVNLGNNPQDAVEQALRWRDAGVTQVGVNSMGFGRRLPEEHIDAIVRFKRAYDEAVRA